MRRIPWLLGFGLVILTAPAVGPVAAETKKIPAFGEGPAYRTLGEIPVMDQGRIKPLDTLARETVKSIYGSTKEAITLTDPSGKPTETWAPVAAFLDWPVRSAFWDKQAFILVDYVPLKRLILADPIRSKLTAIASLSTLAPATRAEFKRLADQAEVSPAELTEAARRPGLTAADRDALLTLATMLSEKSRWMSPEQLESAKVNIEGQKVDLFNWLDDLQKRGRRARMKGGSPTYSTLEARANEMGTRLYHYMLLRDRRIDLGAPVLAEPRPSGPAYLAFNADLLKAFRDTILKRIPRSEGAPPAIDDAKLLGLFLDDERFRFIQGEESWSSFEENVRQTLHEFLKDIPRDEWKLPGKDKAFDDRYSQWLAEKSAWVPLQLLLTADLGELERAGYSASRVTAFRDAFRELETAQEETPGRVPLRVADRVLAAARALGESANQVTYPTPQQVALETYYNRFGPFNRAPMAYGAAFCLLLLSLGITANRRTAVGMLGRVLYLGGMLAFLAGIALEVYGFSFRVRITGWAPVTNMAETVIWVAMVAAVLGLVLELIYRRTYTAAAASGVALLATVLAANVPMLDPNIKALQPVLRSNYWLLIHVLTEVSSYAAFAVAMALGLIGTLFYLTSIYRRSVSYAVLARPLLLGLPLLAAGAKAWEVSAQDTPTGWAASPTVFGMLVTLGFVGLVLTVMSLAALAGEAISRMRFRDEDDPDTSAEPDAPTGPPATSVQTVLVGEGGSVATLTKPSVAEILARAASAPRPQLDARARAMQATAAIVKPLANYIYRTIQVGVLLITAGTMLGGFWADVSWGRFWGWDPKEVWALITLLIYLIPLHGRFAGWVNTFGLTASSVVCFSSVLMAWYGVNFVLGVGLHSYGFTEGGGQGVVMAVTLAVLAVVAGALWRRHLGQQAV